jgi:hypothetical protein
VLPYTYTSTQTAVAASFLGIGGYDGTNYQPAFYDASGVGRVAVCNALTANCASVSTINADSIVNTTQTVAGRSFNYAFNGTTWDRLHKDTYAAGPIWAAEGGSTTTTIAAATAGPTVIKGSAGRLSTVVITTAGTATAVTFYDNASACSGTIIGIIPTTATLSAAVAGAPPYVFNMPAANGITACGGTTSAAVTVSYW